LESSVQVRPDRKSETNSRSHSPGFDPSALYMFGSWIK
jgi:hypothetical protein